MISTEINIDGFGGEKVIVEINVVGEESKTGFFILEIRLAFAELKQAFSTTLILQHFVLEFYIGIEINTSV